MAALTDDQLSAIVSTQISLAKWHDRNEREKSRSKALDYYLGSMDQYVPPETGRSKVVSRDVADTIGWMLPGIMRVFTASDRMAEAEPVGEEDQAFAREATDGMNYVFWKDNKGYEVVYNATWDALLVGNGVVKTYYDEYPIYTSSFHSGLSEDQLALLLQPNEDGEKPEVLAQSERDVLTIDEATGQMVQAKAYDVKIKRKKADGKFCIEVIPPEQFLIDQNAITTDDAAFTAHWERKARTELVEMGYDKDVIWSIPQSAKNQTPEESSRSPLTFDQEATDKSMDLVDYYECFIRIDVDDDGEAELIRACFAGSDSGKLLDWEVWEDEHPFDDIPCEPVPHRWDARSIADETMDVQDVKTVLLRQALNNVYASNNPQRFVNGKVKNPDELVSPTFGGVIWGENGTTVEDLAVPFVANHAFEAIQYQDEVVQRRTGVGRGTMALDPQALQNQTAEAVREGKDAGYSQVEMLARNMAEWGWKKVFRKLMRLMIKHQGQRVIMVAGKPVKLDPRFWNADMDVTINVGLGTGSRDRDMSMLNVIMSTQAAIAAQLKTIPGGQQKALEFIPKIMNAAMKLAESSGLKSPEHYFPSITADDMKAMAQAMQAPPPPDPKVQAEIEKGKAQLQLDAQKNQQDAILSQQKAGAEIQLKREQLAAELELKREQLTAEITLKEALATREMNMKAASGYYSKPSTSTSQVNMGGQPG